MAGCSREQEDVLNQDSQDFEARKLIATGLTTDIARKQASDIITHRKHVNEKYREQDEEGCEGIGAEFSFTSDGDVYFPEYDGYLSELYENQKEVRPHDYDTAEHKTVSAAYESIRNGASQAAHIVHHYDEKGRLDIRDVVVLTFDHTTNSGIMHVLNVSHNGENHHSLESAYGAMRNRLGDFRQEVKESDVYIVAREDKPVDPLSLFRERLDTTETSKMTEERQTIQWGIQWEHKQGEVYGEDRGKGRKDHIAPVTYTAMHADKNKIEIPIHLPFFMQKLLGRDEKGKTIDEGVSLLQKKETQKKSIDEMKKSILFARETGVGIGGALAILHSFGEPHSDLSREKKQRDKKQRNKERKSLSETIRVKDRQTQKEKQRKIIRKKSARKERNEEIGKAESKTLWIGRRRKEKRERKKEGEHVLFSFDGKRRRHTKSEEKICLYVREKRKKDMLRVYRRELQLFTAFMRISRKLKKENFFREGNIKRGGPIRQIESDTSRTEGKQKLRRVVMKFTQAVILFKFLYSVTPWDQMQEHIRVLLKEKKREKRETVSDRYALWVLLSIIWYMTMVREQGWRIVYQNRKGKKKQGKKKKKPLKSKTRWHMPPNGIIYANA